MNDALGEAGLWESRYQSGEDLFGAKPNTFFLEALQARPPGRLLLPGEGEGRNALGALRLGWEVCAFDLSPTARDRACARAEALGKTLTYDLGALPELPEAAPFAEPFDLIAVIFVHLPAAVRRDPLDPKLCTEAGGQPVHGAEQHGAPRLPGDPCPGLPGP